MKNMIVLCLLICCRIIVLSAEEPVAETPTLVTINDRLNRIEADINAIKEQPGLPENNDDQEWLSVLKSRYSTVMKQNSHNLENDPIMTKIDSLTLPPSPTPEQCREYVSAILRLNRMTQYNSQTIAQYKLAFVGPDNIQTLIDALPLNFDTINRNQIDRTISDARSLSEAIKLILQTSSDRPALGKTLSDALLKYPGLINVIFNGGYEVAVKDAFLKNVIENRYSPTDCDHVVVYLLALFREPKTFPFIQNVIVYHSQRVTFFNMLRTIPGFNIIETLERTQDRIGEQGERGDYNYFQFAPYFLEFGIVDSVKTLLTFIDNSAKNEQKNDDRYYEALRLLNQYTGLDSREALLEWGKKAQGRIAFDPEKKLFFIDLNIPLPEPPKPALDRNIQNVEQDAF
ncbi:MAG: hypothetical protein ABIH86_07705 [Planctomycetota bacterium]